MIDGFSISIPIVDCQKPWHPWLPANSRSPFNHFRDPKYFDFSQFLETKLTYQPTLSLFPCRSSEAKSLRTRLTSAEVR